MKILFDQGTPAPLRRFSQSYEVITASEKGWDDLSNGDLITAAERDGFEALVTTDRNLRYQQNLSARKIAIAVILHSAWPLLQQRALEVSNAIAALKPGEFFEL